MGSMPNSLSRTKSVKNTLVLRIKRIIYREYRFYIFNYIFLFLCYFHLAVYILRHLNYGKCACLSFLRIYFYVGGGGYYLDFFT